VKEVPCLLNCSFFALRKRSKAVEEIPEVGLAIDSNYGILCSFKEFLIKNSNDIFPLWCFNLKIGINSK